MKRRCAANWGKIIKNVGENVFGYFSNQAQYSEPYTITIVSDLFDVMQKV